MTTSSARALPLPAVRSSDAGALVLAAALPILVLHAQFQPTASIGGGIQVRLSDLAVLAVLAAAAASARRQGIDALRAGRAIWAAAAAFLLFTFAATFYPLAFAHGYPWRTHFVTAGKYAEYALLAPAVPLLLRRRRDVHVLLAAVAVLSAAATAVGLLQFAGVDIFRAWPSGGRQPSFVGVDDFGALSAVAFALAAACVAVGPRVPLHRGVAWTAGVSGWLGALCSGALAGVLGAVLAGIAAAIVARRWRLLSPRRGIVLALMTATVLAGGLVVRGPALRHFAAFLGIGRTNGPQQVESYSQRWVLDYIGLRMFAHRPLLGNGWQSGYDLEAYGPYLADARARFPGQPARAFPSPQHPWGIQSAYVEALAELGVVGFLLFATMIVAGLLTAVRAVRAGPPTPATPAFLGLLLLLVAGGVWNSLWFIAGIPFDALIWLAFGLAATRLAAAPAR